MRGIRVLSRAQKTLRQHPPNRRTVSKTVRVVEGVFQVSLKVREAIAEYYYWLLPSGDISHEMWRRMLRVPIFRQECEKAAKEIEAGDYGSPDLTRLRPYSPHLRQVRGRVEATSHGKGAASQ